MKNFFKIIFLAFLGLPILLYGNRKNDFEYEFIHDDTCYSFRGSFIVKTEPDCVFNLIHNFNNISDYSLDAKSIKLVRQGDNWYDVTFIYRKFLIFENQSTWRRILCRNDYKIDFIMLSNKNNSTILPKIISSSGYYQIHPETENCLVEFYQECKLKSGFLKNIYIKEAKKEAVRFLKEFKGYIQKSCEYPD
jgi:hypothetical protein